MLQTKRVFPQPSPSSEKGQTWAVESDFSKLNYLAKDSSATIYDRFYLTTLLFVVPHYLSNDYTIGEYNMPCTWLDNAHATLRDLKLWEELVWKRDIH